MKMQPPSAVIRISAGIDLSAAVRAGKGILVLRIQAASLAQLAFLAKIDWLIVILCALEVLLSPLTVSPSSRFSRRLISCLLQRASSSIAFLLSRSSASAILVFLSCLDSISASFLCSSNCCHSHSFFSVSPLILPVSCTFIEIEARLSDGWQRSAISLLDCISEVGFCCSFSGFYRHSSGSAHQLAGLLSDAEGSFLRDPCLQVSVWTEFLLTNLRDLSGWVSSEKVVTLFLPDINIVDILLSQDTKANCCNGHPQKCSSQTHRFASKLSLIHNCTQAKALHVYYK